MRQEGIEITTDGPAVEPNGVVLPAAAEGSRASLSLKILAFLAILTVVYVARDILIPTVFAVLLAFLLRPLWRILRRYRLPDLASAFILVSAVAAIFVFGVVMLAGQAQNWLSQAPDMLQSVSRMVPAQWGPFDDLEKTKAAMKGFTPSNGTPEPVPVEVQSNDFNYTVLGVSSHFLGSAAIAFVLAFFLLGLSDSLLKQAIESRPRFGQKRSIVELVQNLEQGISRYLLTITAINTCLGIATGLALWMLGIPNPILWGVLATTANYVPHVGAFLCMGVLFFVGAVSHQSLAYGLLAAGTFSLLTSLESYFITPMVLSKSLQLSPLATLLAILFCGWMWGIAGGLMAAPLLAVLKITCDQFESLRWLRAFLSGERSAPPASLSPAGVAPPKSSETRLEAVAAATSEAAA